MHTNYYFLRLLSSKLHKRLNGYKLAECYSRQKEEILFVFENREGEAFIIQAHLTGRFSCLYFPDQSSQPKKNSANWFSELIGKTVIKVRQIENDRSFIIEFVDDFQLLFKLYGNRSNVLLFHRSQLIKVFNRKLKNDFSIDLSQLNRSVDFSYDHFVKAGLKKTFFTLGQIIDRATPASSNIDAADSRVWYERGLHVIAELEKNVIYITRYEGRAYLTLYPYGDIFEKYADPIEAVNAYYRHYYKQNFVLEQRQALISRLDHLITGYGQYLEQVSERLATLKNVDGPEKLADIIMANLHAIPRGTDKVSLYDFYNDTTIEVPLKKNVSPQKYAESLYKKARNRPLEIQKLEEIITSRKELIEGCIRDRRQVASIETSKELALFRTRYARAEAETKTSEPELFKRFEYMGYTILVGRNAANNDLLTMKYARKNDGWLHVRDVPGAHVVIRHKAGQGIPRPVIEKAASVAAYYSSRKNEKLCPVIVTEKRFVRKPKGAPKGAVKVEKEKVVMVEPADI